ncbi:hypothetical protein HK096_002634, partial [Nowakowskiella sp. JEL0078]
MTSHSVNFTFVEQRLLEIDRRAKIIDDEIADLEDTMFNLVEKEVTTSPSFFQLIVRTPVNSLNSLNTFRSHKALILSLKRDRLIQDRSSLNGEKKILLECWCQLIIQNQSFEPNSNQVAKIEQDNSHSLRNKNIVAYDESYCWKDSLDAISKRQVSNKNVGSVDPRVLGKKLRESGFRTWLDVERLSAGNELYSDIVNGLLN